MIRILGVFPARRLGEILQNDFLLLSGVGRHRHGIPDLNQKSLQEVDQPKTLGIGVLDGHATVLVR